MVFFYHLPIFLKVLVFTVPLVESSLKDFVSVYRVVSVRGGFWAKSVKILVFPRPTSYMLTSFNVYLLNWEIFYKSL